MVEAGFLASTGHVGLAPVQLSARSQKVAAARHVVPADLRTSGGQSFCTPSHDSGRSHTSTAARQSAVLFASAGQVGWMPSQLSSRSQSPAAGRQTVPAVAGSVSGGQVLLTPSQDSAPSQSPPDGRHTAVLLASTGHEPLDPVQVSAVSQTPADARQTVVAASKVHVGEQQSPATPLPSSHCSPGSTTPLPHADW